MGTKLFQCIIFSFTPSALKRCSFRQMSRAAESPFSSLAVARRPVKGQRQGHIKCSDFTAKLCCISPPVYLFPDGHLFFFPCSKKKRMQTTGAKGLNLISDLQPQETDDASLSSVWPLSLYNPNCYFFLLLCWKLFFSNQNSTLSKMI